MTTTATPALELTHIPLGQLAPHHDNVRKNLGDLDELTKSIAGSGILEPLLVLPADSEGVHLIVAGHRRFAGAQKAKLTEAPCVVRDLTPVEVLEAMLVENLQRADITPIEEARAYARLVELNTKIADIARKVGRSQALVKSRLALVQLPDEILNGVEAGEITLGRAEELVRYADNADAMEYIASRAAKGGVPGPHTVDQFLSVRAKEAAVQGAIDKAHKAGHEVFTPRDAYWVPQYALNSLEKEIKVSMLHLKGGVGAHSSEPCHRVWIETEYVSATEYKAVASSLCINPKRHTDQEPAATRSKLQIPTEYLPAKAGAARSAGESKAEKAERLAREEAMKTRWAFIKDLLPQMIPIDAPDLVVTWIFEDFADVAYYDDAAVFDLLGLDASDEQFDLAQIIDDDRVAGRPQLDRWILAKVLVSGHNEIERPSHSDPGHGARLLRFLVEHGYKPSAVEKTVIAGDEERQAKEAADRAAAAIPDIDDMGLSEEAFDAIVEIHEAVDADPSMGHPGEGIDDTVLEDLKQRGLVDVEFTEAGPAITFTDLGSAVATEVVKQATEIVAPE